MGCSGDVAYDMVMEKTNLRKSLNDCTAQKKSTEGD